MQLFQLDEATAGRRRLFFHAVLDTDGISPVTGITGTGRRSKNGAAVSTTTASVVELNATTMPGRYYIEFTAGELDTVGIIEFRKKAAGYAEIVARGQIVAFDPYTATNMGLTNLDVVVSTRATPAEVNAQVLDVVDVDTLTLPGQAAPTNTPTMREVLGWLYKTFRNKKDQSTTLWQLYDNAGSVVDSKATVSDAAGTATKEEIETGP